MKTTEKALWEKISKFKLDDESAALKFSQRLARENGWKMDYTKKVMDEYKKFIFLCCVSDKQVTPSDQVDQVWHLHLTYTKSYWHDLCKEMLQKELHHNPTKGGKNECEKFDDLYTGTLKLYREKFGSDPPSSTWPPNDERFSDIDFERVNRKKHWIIPKPAYNKRVFLWITVSSLVLMQACNGGDSAFGIFLIIWFGVLGYIGSCLKGKNRKGGNNGGCGGGCGSDSGGDSGCSSGCSGCGGGCGGCGGGCS